MSIDPARGRNNLKDHDGSDVNAAVAMIRNKKFVKYHLGDEDDGDPKRYGITPDQNTTLAGVIQSHIILVGSKSMICLPSRSYLKKVRKGMMVQVVHRGPRVQW